ncbi:MAG TPA: LysR family transcriptional regulator [Bosea sp. (in: a-proteobacteria)]|jgi:DNA-binding transcriptional LysR family regulator|uniref:LysR family transcriptional regulator n=1 Tax=Bosea sp. (in: a-proteobacteria) TaxID=1871050 RepID=UPI002E0F6F4F|nr:LysR family transcriptional regulator [Bosea sp. (in: a-proteobacteria)]
MDVIGSINMKVLQTFLVVAEKGSFRAAAETLNRSHSAVCAQIMQIEAQLGVPLFERTTRSVKLTVEGSHLRDSARKAFYEINLGLRRIREESDAKRGQLSLACSSHMASIHLPPVLTEFVRTYPGIAVTVRELTSRDLYEALRNKEVDFAVGPEDEDATFDFTTVMVEPLQALVPHHFLDRPRDSITLAELSRLPMLVQTQATAVRRLLEDALQKQGLEISTRYQFIQAETVIAMAEAGLGVAVQPASRLKKTTLSATAVLDLTEPRITRSMAMITLRKQNLSPAAQNLADKIVQDVRKRTDFYGSSDAQR